MTEVPIPLTPRERRLAILAALRGAREFLNHIHTIAELACAEHIAELDAAIALAEAEVRDGD